MSVKKLAIRLFCLSLLLPLVSGGPLFAQVKNAEPQHVLPLTRLSEPITLDGLSDEAAWDAVEPVPMVMYQPTFEGAMTERTDIRIAYDENHLYVAGRLYDSEPENVLASSLYRDKGTAADDYLNIVLDPFNDNENGLWFWTNPAGVRGDIAISDDLNNFRTGMNPSWDTFWDVATVQNEDGWFAEMRIPFSSIGFQDQDGEVQMGVAISRVISRKNERHVFPSIPPNWTMGFAKPSLAQDVSLASVTNQRPVYITPYVLGGADRQAQLNPAETAYQHDNGLTRDIGLDLKYNLTSNLTLDLTVNTDFAQVEADDQQLNLSRFSLFFPEKRQFFQERAGIFEYGLGFQDRIFHSRQIGLNEDGGAVPIIGGARLVGRMGSWDLGFMNMQTARADELPSENFGLLRLRRQVLNENSFVGGIVTSRIGHDGSYNLVSALDGRFRVVGDEYLTVKVAHAVDDEFVEDNTYDAAKASLIRVEWQRRRQQGFNYSLWFTQWGEQFVPRMGFYTQTGFSQPFGRMGYGWILGENSRIRQISINVFGNTFVRNSDGKLDLAYWGNFNRLEMKSGEMYSISTFGSYEDLPDTLSLPKDTYVPSGTYTFYSTNINYTSPAGRRLQVDVGLRGGQLYDGYNASVELKPTWFASKHFELGVEYQLNLVRFPDRDQRFDAHIARVRTQVALNTKVSASAFVQYSNVAELMGINLRFRYNFRERNDLWIVYNEGLNTNRFLARPTLPLSDQRTLLLKYTYTFGV